MAGIREIALGLTSVLISSRQPDPLPVTLKGQSLADVALLIRSVIRECADTDVPLRKVEIGTDLLRRLLNDYLLTSPYLGVRILGVDRLGTELLFYRRGARVPQDPNSG